MYGCMPLHEVLLKYTCTHTVVICMCSQTICADKRICTCIYTHNNFHMPIASMAVPPPCWRLATCSLFGNTVLFYADWLYRLQAAGRYRYVNCLPPRYVDSLTWLTSWKPLPIYSSLWTTDFAKHCNPYHFIISKSSGCSHPFPLSCPFYMYMPET